MSAPPYCAATVPTCMFLRDTRWMRARTARPRDHMTCTFEDTILDKCIRDQRALGQQPEKRARLEDPASREGQAIHMRIANNLIGKAAAQVATEVRGTVNDQDRARLLSLHPPALNIQHRAAGQKQPLPEEGQPKLIITGEHIIQAAQTAPRGSSGGPDSIVLDLLTRSLLKVRCRQVQRSGANREGNRPDLCLLDALQVVIQQFVDGEVPADVALPLFSATGFAFSKPGGGIRLVACGVALCRLAFRTIVRASTDSLRAALGATQFGVSFPGAARSKLSSGWTAPTPSTPSAGSSSRRQ
jgi:hypothetical protein